MISNEVGGLLLKELVALREEVELMRKSYEASSSSDSEATRVEVVYTGEVVLPDSKQEPVRVKVAKELGELAAAVRGAVERFTGETGLAVQVGIEYAQGDTWCGGRPRVKHVVVSPAFKGLSA